MLRARQSRDFNPSRNLQGQVAALDTSIQALKHLLKVQGKDNLTPHKQQLIAKCIEDINRKTYKQSTIASRLKKRSKSRDAWSTMSSDFRDVSFR